MATEPAAIDISDKPELAELVRQLLADGKPRELRRGDEVLGVLSPAAEASAVPARHVPNDDDIAAFESAAGGWAGEVDIEALHEAFAESRRLSISKSPTG